MPHESSILIVDDTPANLQLLLGMLQQAGYRVRPVTSGAHALRAVQSEPPDLILLDITMPEMDGYEVCRRLKADPATAEIPILFISALTDTEDKVRAFETGGVDYVSKPFQLAEVLARVRTHLQLRRSQRALQESLARERELERLRDSLAHMIAHDMRSPLLAVRLAIDLAKDTVAPADRELLDQAKVSIATVVGMINDMLDVSRLEAGALALTREPVELVALATATLEPLRPLAGRIEVRLEAPAPLTLAADRELLRRVLANLLANAFKFAPADGHVALRILASGTGARVEVADDGRGIAPADRPRLFTKFGQLESDQKKSGCGLGLAFAKLAIEAHGGTIGVDSTPGHGSTFWFTLPATP